MSHDAWKTTEPRHAYDAPHLVEVDEAPSLRCTCGELCHPTYDGENCIWEWFCTHCKVYFRPAEHGEGYEVRGCGFSGIVTNTIRR